MKYIISAALEAELKQIREAMVITKEYQEGNHISIDDNYKDVPNNGFKFWEGTLDGHDVVLMQTWVSRTHAATATTLAVKNYGTNVIHINTGSSGAGHKDIPLLSTVISTNLYYGENVVPGWKFGQVPRMIHGFKTNPKLLSIAKKLFLDEKNVFVGPFGCSESFIKDKNQHEFMTTRLPEQIDSIDMESTAVAHVCYMFNIPFIGFRTTSDNLYLMEEGESDTNQFYDYVDKVGDKYLSMIRRFIKEHKKHI